MQDIPGGGSDWDISGSVLDNSASIISPNAYTDLVREIGFSLILRWRALNGLKDCT